MAETALQGGLAGKTGPSCSQTWVSGGTPLPEGQGSPGPTVQAAGSCGDCASGFREVWAQHPHKQPQQKPGHLPLPSPGAARPCHSRCWSRALAPLPCLLTLPHRHCQATRPPPAPAGRTGTQCRHTDTRTRGARVPVHGRTDGHGAGGVPMQTHGRGAGGVPAHRHTDTRMWGGWGPGAQTDGRTRGGQGPGTQADAGRAGSRRTDTRTQGRRGPGAQTGGRTWGGRGPGSWPGRPPLPVLLLLEGAQAEGDLGTGEHGPVPCVQVRALCHRQQARQDCNDGQDTAAQCPSAGLRA